MDMRFQYKKASIKIEAFRSLVFASGFEPLAFRLGGGRSILLSYANLYPHAEQVLVYHKKYRSDHNK